MKHTTAPAVHLPEKCEMSTPHMNSGVELRFRELVSSITLAGVNSFFRYELRLLTELSKAMSKSFFEAGDSSALTIFILFSSSE